MSRTRHQNTRDPEVMYIGFERPKPRNGWGVAGFVVSLCSLLTCGFTSPVGLLMSLFALRKGPRGLATAGTVLGLAGSMVWVLGGLSIYQEAHQHEHRRARRAMAVAQQDTSDKIAVVLHLLDEHREEHGDYPQPIDGNVLAVEHEDGWKNSLRYEVYKDEGVIAVRSAGPDAKFENRDDIVVRKPIDDKSSKLTMR